MNRVAALVIILMLLTPAVTGSRVEAPPERAYSAFSTDPARRFDFWIGEWEVNLRMRQDDLSFEDSVAAETSIYSILNGKAILELWDSTPIKGFSLRYYNSVSRKWELWLDWPGPNRSSLSSLAGGFRHGRGEFRDDVTDERGVTTTSVYSFNDITPFSLRWEDRFSTDGGKSWEQNWVMEFTRTAVEPKWPIRPRAVSTYKDGGRCDDERFRPHELLVGEWRSEEVSFTFFPILDGCAVIGFLDAGEGGDEFVFLTFDSFREQWVTAVLDERPETAFVRYGGAKIWTDLSSEEGGALEWVVWSKPGDLRKAGARLSYRRGDRELELERLEDQGPLGR